jgi:hypothetical protein
VSLLDANGNPINPLGGKVPGAAEQSAIVEGLPGWLHGAKYRADDDIITLLVGVPASTHALAHLLALETTPEQARALIDALTKLVAQSEAVVLDASTSSD